MQKIKVNTHRLNLRNEPNLSSSIIIGVLDRNEELEVLNFVDDFRWAKIKKSNGKIGYCSYKYCLGVPNPNDIYNNDYNWLKVGFGELNTTELADPKENHRILTYLRSCEFLDDGYKDSDETAWCSAFMNWSVEKAGYAGTNSAWALSWKNWGQPASKRRGRIAVFERYVTDGDVTHTRGHVGFYLGMVDGQISLLGGNQSNSVSIGLYPVDDENYKFLGCRKA